MLTQQTKGIESNSGNGSRILQPWKKEKRPKTFMFIDSSNGGINAKPDRGPHPSSYLKPTDQQSVVEASTPRLLPIDPHRSSETAATDWVAACIQSPIGAPFIYAALTASARAAKLDPEVYKWRAISEVNRLLTDSHKNIDDTTIAAVLMLLALEEADLADPRRKGDERRCSRGGLAALGQNRCLQIFLLMHSIAQSITTFKSPYALLLDANGQIEDYNPIPLQSPASFTGILRSFHNLGIDRALFDIVSTITVFISDLTAWYETGTCLVDSFELQKHASFLMYRLFDWYKSHVEHQNQGVKHLDESICLALMIFMVNATEPNTLSFGSRLSRAVTKLHTSLGKVPLLHWSPSPDLLLWTLAMGALGAKGILKGSRSPTGTEPELSFFMQLSHTAFPGRSFNMPSKDLELLLEKMRGCLWIPSIFDERLKRLWVSMGLCKPGVVEFEDINSSSEEERDQVVDDEYALGQSTTLRFFSADGKKRPKREPPG
ncbi:Nn.00g086950.m01.CDS01 [Neocucurbitaria sp. VM-36]